MAELEIECKFLLLPCKAKKVLNSHHIPYKKNSLEQFYVSTEASPYTRYRKKGKSYYQTIKSGEGLVRTEIEKEVSRDEYIKQRKRSLGRIITKNRFLFEYESDIYELDIFKGSLEGLCYLEIEFTNESKAKSFQLPKIFEPLLVTEVTYETAFNNSALTNSKIFPTPQLSHTYLNKAEGLYHITPFLSTYYAVNTMIYLLVEQIQGYKQTLLENPHNIEALHQFRIHMRKLHALLREFAPFFDKKWLERYKKILSSLMEKTNAKRDNDVALIDIKTFKKQLSDKSKNSLDLLKDSMKKKDKNLSKDLSIFMSGKSLSSELDTLSHISGRIESYPESAKQPLILVSIITINNRIDEIIELGNKLRDSDKKGFHKLRIQFKRLRYLLELLSPIIEPSRLENALKHLKTIQTLLGEINDLEVQKSELKRFDKKKKSNQEKALKDLYKKMDAKEKKRMKAFSEAFQTFKSEKPLYKTLLLYNPDPITL